MKIRKITLPSGWVASNREEMSLFESEWKNRSFDEVLHSSWMLLPHAGWFYSGELAWHLLSSLDYVPDLVVLLGGHLSPQDPLLIWDFDVCESTLGNVPVHRGLTDEIQHSLNPVADLLPDNTIEVFLPFLVHLWPGTPMAGLRIPPSFERLEQADQLYSFIKKHARRPLLIASTDLTHYGPNYRFFPDLAGETAEEWVRKNDRKLIDYIEKGSAEDVLKSAALFQNACSAGAAAWAVRCASLDQSSLSLREYSNSLAKGPSESFVGYASMASS